MVKSAKIEDARILANLAIQMWTDHDPEELEKGNWTKKRHPFKFPFKFLEYVEAETNG